MDALHHRGMFELDGDEGVLADRWRSAQPFPHVLIDDFARRPDELLSLLEEEPVERYEGDLFVFEASAPEPRSDELRSLRASFAGTLAAPLSRITGKQV